MNTSEQQKRMEAHRYIDQFLSSGDCICAGQQLVLAVQALVQFQVSINLLCPNLTAMALLYLNPSYDIVMIKL